MKHTQIETYEGINAILYELIEQRGETLYGGEAVTQLQHALQCAQLAEDEGAPPALITAALLHNAAVSPAGNADETRKSANDGQVEGTAEAFLSQWFGPDVREPLRLNTQARRYLSAVETGYLDGLPSASHYTLMHAGGPMSAVETTAFEAESYAADALRLLRWQDRCARANAPTRNLAHFLAYAMGCMRWAAR